MLLGLQLNYTSASRFGNAFDTLRALAQACEQTGLDSILLADHFMFPDREHPEKEVPVPECFVSLGALAAVTERIRIGELVTGMPYRNPALVAKMLCTLDIISHGRTLIGLGAAWHEPEFKGYGWNFPSLRERMEMLEEGIQVVDRMLTRRPASFHGKHYTIDGAYNDPPPVQRPLPPIMIGGSGERVTLRLVAQYAEMCNVSGDPAEVARLFGVLRQHCERAGRPFEAITRSNHVGMLIARDEAELAAKRARFPGFAGVVGTPEMVIARLREYAQIGSQYITFNMPDAPDIEPIRLLGEAVLPVVAKF